MPKRVLNVGQCVPDNGSITRFLQKHFDVAVDTAETGRDTFDRLRQQPYDLVLINRKLDIDYSDGMEILRRLKQDESLKSVPVMLVSNYADAQEQAVAAGAEYGFGKSEYNAPEVVERLRPFLAE